MKAPPSPCLCHLAPNLHRSEGYAPNASTEAAPSIISLPVSQSPTSLLLISKLSAPLHSNSTKFIACLLSPFLPCDHRPLLVLSHLSDRLSKSIPSPLVSHHLYIAQNTEPRTPSCERRCWHHSSIRSSVGFTCAGLGLGSSAHCSPGHATQSLRVGLLANLPIMFEPLL